MPIVFASITPHPPIIIPSIGKENLELLKQTSAAFDTLRKKLEEKKVDTILIISPHGPIDSKVFRINHLPKYTANFKDFGDFSTQKEWLGDIRIGYQIRKALETNDILQLVSEETLDHGLSVPLIMLTKNLPKTKIIPLYYSGLSHKKHFTFGQSLFKILQKKRNRTAVIASGDLSHCLTKEAPGGFSKKAKKFDNKLIKLLQQKKPEEILGLDENFIEEIGECGLKSILILLGCINKLKHKPKLLSYEAPFGVGYLTMNFEI